MLDLNGNRSLPQSLEEVPFDQPFRVLFSFCYSPPKATEEGVVYAELEEIMPV